MSEKLFIAHSVYLTPEERRSFGRQPQTIDTVGISVPSNTKDLDAKLTEVFVRYLITTEMNEKNIEIMSDGYKISFNNYSELKSILNFNEGGSEWLLLELDSNIEKDNELIAVHHQVVFKDISAQERTTVCSLLGHYLKEKK